MDELRLREDWSQRLYWVVPIHTELSSCNGYTFAELYDEQTVQPGLFINDLPKGRNRALKRRVDGRNDGF